APAPSPSTRPATSPAPSRSTSPPTARPPSSSPSPPTPPACARCEWCARTYVYVSFLAHHSLGDRLAEGVEQQADEAADDGAVDADELEVAAEQHLELAGHDAGVPPLHGRPDHLVE